MVLRLVLWTMPNTWEIWEAEHIASVTKQLSSGRHVKTCQMIPERDVSTEMFENTSCRNDLMAYSQRDDLESVECQLIKMVSKNHISQYL